MLGVNVKQWEELRGLALATDPSLESTALVNLAERFLGVTLDKSGQLADYSQSPLPDWLVQYSAIDAVVSHDINWAIKKKSPIAGRALLEAPDGLKVGTAVQLFLRGKVVASAVVDFVGGHGSVKKWGKMSVGSKKAIARSMRSKFEAEDFGRCPLFLPFSSLLLFRNQKLTPRTKTCAAS